MALIYNPSPVKQTTITVPVDGELASALSIVDPVERSADNIKYVTDGIDGTSPGVLTPSDINVAAGSFAADATQITCGVPLVVPATTTCSQPVTINATLNVSGATTLDGDVTLGNAPGDTITCTGAITCNAAFTANGATITLGNAGSDVITCNGLLRAHGDTIIGDSVVDTLTINATETYNAKKQQGTGGYLKSVVFEMPDSNVAAYALETSGQEVYIPTGVLGADRDLSLTNSSIYLGASIHIYSSETTRKVTVKDGGSTIAEVRKGGSSGQYETLRVTWVLSLGGWVVSGGHKIP